MLGLLKYICAKIVSQIAKNINMKTLVMFLNASSDGDFHMDVIRRAKAVQEHLSSELYTAAFYGQWLQMSLSEWILAKAILLRTLWTANFKERILRDDRRHIS